MVITPSWENEGREDEDGLTIGSKLQLRLRNKFWNSIEQKGNHRKTHCVMHFKTTTREDF